MHPWQPTPGTTWQWQLTQPVDTSYNVQVYDVDLFDTPQTTLDQLHAAGRTVICYFSGGGMTRRGARSLRRPQRPQPAASIQ
jgi:hypothetical protein